MKKLQRLGWVIAGAAMLFAGNVFADSINTLNTGSGGASTPTVNTGSGAVNTSVGLTNPLGASCTDLTCPVARVTNLLFTIAVPLCAIIVLIGGFQMMTAAGDPEKFSKGKKTILYAAIGFAVVLIAGSVAKLIQSFFGTS